jgi:hypothetical protein
MLGERDDPLRAHRDGGLKISGLRFGTNDKDDAATPRQRTVGAASGGGRIEQYGHGAGPRIATRRVGRVHDGQSDSCRDTVDIVSKRVVVDERQDPVGCGHDVSLPPPTNTPPSRQ